MYKDKDKQREANAERQRRYKAKQKALPKQGVTVIVPQDVVTPERCQYCGCGLPALQRPRQYPGSCYRCAMEQPAKSVQSNGEQYYTPVFIGKMTIMEQLFYRPVLKPGQTNFVSLPGRACYGVH